MKSILKQKRKEDKRNRLKKIRKSRIVSKYNNDKKGYNWSDHTQLETSSSIPNMEIKQLRAIMSSDVRDSSRKYSVASFLSFLWFLCFHSLFFSSFIYSEKLFHDIFCLIYLIFINKREKNRNFLSCYF